MTHPLLRTGLRKGSGGLRQRATIAWAPVKPPRGAIAGVALGLESQGKAILTRRRPVAIVQPVPRVIAASKQDLSLTDA